LSNDLHFKSPKKGQKRAKKQPKKAKKGAKKALFEVF